MKKYSAIATLEFKDIPVALYATDAMLKKAPIGLIRSGTISQGRFLTLIAGSTGSVDEAFTEGLRLGGKSIIDSVLMLDVHDRVYNALMGERKVCVQEAMGIIETATVSSNIRAAELALKATDVELIEMRIADSHLNGKGLSIYQGALHEIEAAIEIAESFLKQKKVPTVTRLIPAPNVGLVEQVNVSTHFAKTDILELDGES